MFLKLIDIKLNIKSESNFFYITQAKLNPVSYHSIVKLDPQLSLSIWHKIDKTLFKKKIKRLYEDLKI